MAAPFCIRRAAGAEALPGAERRGTSHRTPGAPTAPVPLRVRSRCVEQPPPAPKTVEVDRARSVTLTWPDGHVSRFGLEELRIACPCAFCRSLRERGAPSWPRPGASRELRAEGAELVGNWGLQLRWSDGHETGIYPWSLLRAWCPCPQCSGRPDLPVDGGPDG
jgi:DUF971 family protein